MCPKETKNYRVESSLFAHSASIDCLSGYSAMVLRHSPNSSCLRFPATAAPRAASSSASLSFSPAEVHPQVNSPVRRTMRSRHIDLQNVCAAPRAARTPPPRLPRRRRHRILVRIFYQRCHQQMSVHPNLRSRRCMLRQPVRWCKSYKMRRQHPHRQLCSRVGNATQRSTSDARRPALIVC